MHVSHLKAYTVLSNIQRRNQRTIIVLVLLAIPVVYITIFIIQQIIWMLGMVALLLIVGWFLLNFKRR